MFVFCPKQSMQQRRRLLVARPVYLGHPGKHFMQADKSSLLRCQQISYIHAKHRPLLMFRCRDGWIMHTPAGTWCHYFIWIMPDVPVH